MSEKYGCGLHKRLLALLEEEVDRAGSILQTLSIIAPTSAMKTHADDAQSGVYHIKEMVKAYRKGIAEHLEEDLEEESGVEEEGES